jgi:ketosteroid isomerase-like protein
MAGLYPPHQGSGAVGPYPESHPGAHHSQPFAAAPTYPEAYVNPFPSAHYGGPLPPAVPYPKRRRWRLVVGVLVALAVIGALVTTIVFAVQRDPGTTNTVVTASSAKQAIQNYLDALQKNDVETIARNSLCGLYDAVKDRRSDNALATLSSDAFQKQFSSAEVTSVDAIVFASPTAAQVLFTMNVVPASGSRVGTDAERQGVAQVLAHDNQILVCSYVLRTAGMF